MTADQRRVFLAQGVRALVYGFAAVLLGASAAARGLVPRTVGLLLGAVVAGTALASIGVGAFAERLGRRRCYALLYAALAVTGAVFGLTDRLWALVLVALLGALSTEVVESGPFTSLEQAMLAETTPPEQSSGMFARYNAVATVAGSLGALAAGGPAALHLHLGHASAATDRRLFWLLVPAGLAGGLLAAKLSRAVEAPAPRRAGQRPLERSRRRVLGLAGLFAADSLGGGFVVQSFLAYWFQRRFGVSIQTLGVLFFAVGWLQAGSFLAAGRLAGRFGLLPTMVFTHLPSNLLLAAIAFAPNLGTAVALLLARFALSQMDVPTRQAYVMALVDPAERAAAAAWTNTARYVVRPAGTALAGTVAQVALGAPFLLAGSLKAAYDLALWSWFRKVPMPQSIPPAPAAVPVHSHPSKEGLP